MTQLQIIREFVNAMLNRNYSSANLLLDKIEDINYRHRGMTLLNIVYEFGQDSPEYIDIVRKMILRDVFCDDDSFNRVPRELVNLLTEYDIQKRIVQVNPKAYKKLFYVRVITKDTATDTKMYPTINLTFYTMIRTDIKKEFEYLNAISDLNLL